MNYKIITTNAMNNQLDNCISYIINDLCNPDAADHLLTEIETIYSFLKDNPYIFRLSTDPILSLFGYREAKINNMNYIIIYRISEDIVYILGIFNTLENRNKKIILP